MAEKNNQMYQVPLILIMLNKLKCNTHFWFSTNQITWSRLLIQIHILNDKQCRSRSDGFWRSQLIWIYSVSEDRTYPGSAGPGLTFAMQWANLADNKTDDIFLIFPRKCRLWHFIHFSLLDKLYEMSKPTFLGKIWNTFQNAVRWKGDKFSFRKFIIFLT